MGPGMGRENGLGLTVGQWLAGKCGPEPRSPGLPVCSFHPILLLSVSLPEC
jgi:hypothetical protein